MAGEFWEVAGGAENAFVAFWLPSCSTGKVGKAAALSGWESVSDVEMVATSVEVSLGLSTARLSKWKDRTL